MKRIAKNVLRIIEMFLIMMICICNIAFADVVPEKVPENFVNDFAYTLTDNEVKSMNEKAQYVFERYGVRMVFCIVDYELEGDNIVDSYVTPMCSEYNIDVKGMDMLILVSVKGNLVHEVVGKELQKYIPEAKVIKAIKTYAVPEFEREQYALGLIALQKALVYEAENSIQLEASNSQEATINYDTTPNEDDSNDNFPYYLLVFWMWLMVFNINARRR